MSTAGGRVDEITQLIEDAAAEVVDSLRATLRHLVALAREMAPARPPSGVATARAEVIRSRRAIRDVASAWGSNCPPELHDADASLGRALLAMPLGSAPPAAIEVTDEVARVIALRLADRGLVAPVASVRAIIEMFLEEFRLSHPHGEGGTGGTP